MEIRRLFRAKNFFLGILIASCGLFFGASYPDGEALKKLLEAGHFLEMEAKAFSSRPFLLLLPIAAVLPWSDSFLLEKQGGFLKSALPRTGRRYYVESKVFTTSLGGFLAVLFAGIFVCFAFFTVFFPREAQGKIAADSFVSLLFLILRSSLLGGILASFGGICGALGNSVYLALGLPFVSYYFCVILRDRYFKKALWLYPPQWVEGSAKWGENGLGLWLFLLLFLGFLMVVHGGILYEKLEDL